MKKICILGAGTFGVALASILHEAGHRVCLWSALSKEIDALARTREHPKLIGLRLADEIALTAD
ncbi:MAG: glycerol-3-phosphate dehydrogenase, partial [Clostridia bacterium]|nr:glycerol-3-phosphate dehydrogenase [Clostridia bacterium]